MRPCTLETVSPSAAAIDCSERSWKKRSTSSAARLLQEEHGLAALPESTRPRVRRSGQRPARGPALAPHARVRAGTVNTVAQHAQPGARERGRPR
jgi:hypothetical protein